VGFTQEARELPFNARRLMCEIGIAGESAHVRLQSVSWGVCDKKDVNTSSQNEDQQDNSRR
jgi:hypothetical protein